MKVRKRIWKGLTQIELLFGLLIVGILAAIAIPVYRDFSIRTRVAELIAAAGALKLFVSEKAAQDGYALTAAGVGLTVSLTGKVTGGSVTDGGVITITGSSTSVGTAVTIVLTPSLASDGKITWACSTSPATYKFVPSECRR